MASCAVDKAIPFSFLSAKKSRLSGRLVILHSLGLTCLHQSQGQIMFWVNVCVSAIAVGVVSFGLIGLLKSRHILRDFDQ